MAEMAEDEPVGPLGLRVGQTAVRTKLQFQHFSGRTRGETRVAGDTG